jgi:hypothetical protein
MGLCRGTRATRLESERPGAAASLREGLAETLTVIELGLTGRLRLTLRTTNPIDNLFGSVRKVSKRVTPRCRSSWLPSGLTNGCLTRRKPSRKQSMAAAHFQQATGHRPQQRRLRKHCIGQGLDRPGAWIGRQLPYLSTVSWMLACPICCYTNAGENPREMSCDPKLTASRHVARGWSREPLGLTAPA